MALGLPAFPWVIAHGSALLGLFFAVKAWSYWLDRYLLLYGDNGVVVGAAYTDVNVELPVLWALVALASVAAIASWANMWMRSYRLPAVSAGLVFGASFVLGFIVPALFQRIYVKPNELQLETPYLRRNISLTQEAYNLRQITVKPFPAEQGLTLQSLQDNRATIDNIRLWDWQPLIDTYAQLQEIRTYYKFLDVDVDRYELGGSYQQVMLSARELEATRLPPNAQTWVNQHLIFTHGNGVVMSPVTQKSAEGLPIFYLHDIPAIASGGPPLTEPRIYFGQSAKSYVIVKGNTPVDAHSSDQHQLTPMVDAVEVNMGRKPEQVSADAGYCSDANLEAMESRNIDAYIAAGRAKHPTDGEGGSKRVAAMREKIRAGGHDTPYRLRKQLPEPVFGQIKQARGFRQFLLRGLDKVALEWGLVCLAHNMLKLAQGRSRFAPMLATA